MQRRGRRQHEETHHQIAGGHDREGWHVCVCGGGVGGLSWCEDWRERDVFVDGPTIFGYRTVATLQHQVRRPATAFDQLDGAGVLHAFGALAVNLQNLVSYLREREYER